MGMMTRIAGLFAARKTQPDYSDNRALAYFPRKKGGILVTHEKALELAACFGCCRVISEDIAKLPWNVYSRMGERRTRLDGSHVHILLNTRPNPNMTAFTFRETLMMWALTWGNGYAEIERDISGRAVALWPISPDRVDPKRAPDGSVYYEVNNLRGETSILYQRDMFHIHGIGWDGLMGYSMIALAAQTLGFALAAEEHGANFFGNNTTIGLALKTDMALGDTAYQRLKDEIKGRQGSARAYEGMILEQGLDFAYTNMSQVDAQYVETRRQTVEEICRWFRVPPHKVAELSRAHFANVENLNIDYATDALLPWIKRLEEEADWKLVSQRAQADFTKIAIQALMRGDSAARANFYKEMFMMGVFSPNEIRALEDMDPIGPEGDEHYIQSQFTTLSKILEEPVQEEVEDNTGEAVEMVASRYLSQDIRKAESALMRYPEREKFAGWVTNEIEKTSYTRKQGFIELEKLVDGLDGNAAYDIYAQEARAQMIGLTNNEKPDYAKVTQSILEIIK